jgi:hypothetical protein
LSAPPGARSRRRSGRIMTSTWPGGSVACLARERKDSVQARRRLDRAPRLAQLRERWTQLLTT